jgi:hypothetical protein
MNLRLVLITLVIITSTTSCYKKMYLGCNDSRVKEQAKNDSLVQEENRILALKSELTRQKDSLELIYNTAITQNKQLKAQNIALNSLVDSELTVVNNVMIVYFGKVGKIARDNLPPCSNAANGWMREYIVHDPQIISLTNPKLGLKTKPASELLDIFTTFATQNYQAFNNNGNYAPPGFVAFRDATLDHAGAILSLGLDILSVVTSGGNDKSWAQFAKDLGTIIPNISKESKCYGGANANGWISVSVNGSAKNTLAKFNGYNMYDSGTRIGQIDLVLQKSFNQLLALSTQGHNPWLLPSWQLGYYAIMQATALKLSSLN